MEKTAVFTPVMSYFRERLNPFVRENTRIIVNFSFTLLFLGIGIWFIKHEGTELTEVKMVLTSASWKWVMAGLGMTCIYIFLQGLMYVYSFAAIRQEITLKDSIILFLKRNFVSIFLPAGGISSLAFFTGTIEKKGIKKSQIHFASSIYGFTGILSVVIIALPVFIYEIFRGSIGSGEWFALAALLVLLGLLFLLYRSVLTQGAVFGLITRWFPAAEVFISDLQNQKIDIRKFLYTLAASVFIELTGITHLYIAMTALGINPSITAAIMGYIISVIFLIISPFLRGLGAIEVSMSYLLIRFGFTNVEAIAITFLYRFFEFWIPLFCGIAAFIAGINKFLFRVLPALFLFSLGIINIISVLTPAIGERLTSLKEFLPVEIIHASNYLVLTIGLFLLITAAFMLKGLRTAWWFGISLSALSLIGHLTKAIDYEEAIAAMFVIIAMIATRKEYIIRSNPRLRNTGITTSLIFTAAVIIYGTLGFYYLDVRHFKMEFGIIESLKYTLLNYFLIGSGNLKPTDPFAIHFIYSLNISGFLSLSFLIYTLVRTYKTRKKVTDEETAIAFDLVSKNGNSALDYFKTYPDKQLFITNDQRSFLSYRISGNFAVVLEDPVCSDTNGMIGCIREFDAYCFENSLKSIYYRVPETSLDVYHRQNKKDLFIGQEGTVDLSRFSLEGGNKKSMRNALNKVSDKGYKATVHVPPIKDGLLQKLKYVSNEWLEDTGREEIVFSQGMFIWNELKNQTIITVENQEEKIIAFLNIVPDFVRDEATYDLLRKTKDAPNGVMDFILVEMFRYLKAEGYRFVNIGFAPLSGINDPHKFPERSMKFAYEKIRSFSHYKGMREYKEKFDPTWTNRYIVYQHDYDLLQLPAVLSQIIKP